MLANLKSFAAKLTGGESQAAPIQNLNDVPKTRKLVDVKAEEYDTPQKYLDGAEIPTFYQFQSNLVGVWTKEITGFLITATDVIHAWSVPSLGIKMDACPGRLSRVFTFIQREGVFYGQCSELCGALHGMMPIAVEAVSPEVYAKHARKWYKE